MNERYHDEDQRSLSANPYPEDYEGPGLIDALRFLYHRRLKLAGRFIAFFGIGLVAVIYLRLTAPTTVQGTLALTFRGIERNQYPTGKPFSVEDFRSPDLLTNALADAGIPKGVLDVRTLAAHLLIVPVIPEDIQARWRKQDKDGVRKDEYFPNEFSISIDVGDLNKAQRLRLFDALVSRYRERVKFEQESAMSFIPNSNDSYEVLAATYDFWDIPALFLDSYRSIVRQVSILTAEALQYPDAKYQLAFRNVARDLNTWYATRLQTLEALTYEGRLVKDRNFVMLRLQYRIEDMDIQIRQKSQEITESEHLLGLVDRPRATLAANLGADKGVPQIDYNAIDKMIKSDYVRPVVERITKLQEEVQSLNAEKARLQNQLALLPKANNASLDQLPPGYQELIRTLSKELNILIERFNKLLDEYLAATITSLVIVKQSPLITREGSSPLVLLTGVVLASMILAVSLLSVEHLFGKLKGPAHPRQFTATK